MPPPILLPSESEDPSDDDGARSRRRLRDIRQRKEQLRAEHEARDDEEEETEEPALVCAVESVKLLVTLLSCLYQGKKEQRIRCDIDDTGMVLTSHSRGKSLQIKTSLGAELFDTYEFHGGGRRHHDDDDALGAPLSFALHLNTLIECLSMFGSAALATSSLRLSYVPATASVTLVVEDNGVICECAMQVLELEGNDIGQLEFEGAFEQSAVIGRCIIQSEPLHDAFAELYDLPSAACVTIAMFGDDTGAGGRRCLSLRATSETGSCEIDFARSSSAFIEFQCEGGECAATFHVAVLQQAFKALAHSNETFLRMNADGFLSVQHMLETGTGDKAFVDALISPEDTSVG